MWRVMQVTETGEEFCVFEGSASQCDYWMDENADNFHESRFYVENV